MVRLIVGPLLALTLAACAHEQPVADQDMGALDIAKPIHVERVRVQYDAAFVPGQADLPYDQAVRLETFLDQAGVRPSDSVYVASPSGDPMAAPRAARIARLLAERSVGMVQIAPPPSGVAANHLVLFVDRYIARAPACPDWSQSPATGHDNVPNGNFGCADAADLAEMVDNPRDLAMGRQLSPAYADPMLDAVDRYRTDTVKPLLNASSSGSSSSGSGQSGSSQSGSSSSGGSSSTTSSSSSGGSSMPSQ